MATATWAFAFYTLLFLFVHKPEWPKLTDPRWNRGFSFRTYFLDVYNYWELRRQYPINLSHVLEKIRLLLLTLIYIFYFMILADTINYPPTITKSDICIVRIKFVLRSPENLASPWELEGYVDAFWAGSPSDRQAISTRDIVFFCERKSYNMEKQEEEEENTKCSCSSELTWLQHFLQELGFSGSTPIPLLCDNQVAILILYTWQVVTNKW